MAREVLSGKHLFAELLSQGLDMATIRDRMVLRNNTAQSFMNRICKDLGWQARG